MPFLFGRSPLPCFDSVAELAVVVEQAAADFVQPAGLPDPACFAALFALLHREVIVVWGQMGGAVRQSLELTASAVACFFGFAVQRLCQGPPCPRQTVGRFLEALAALPLQDDEVLPVVDSYEALHMLEQRVSCCPEGHARLASGRIAGIHFAQAAAWGRHVEVALQFSLHLILGSRAGEAAWSVSSLGGWMHRLTLVRGVLQRSSKTRRHQLPLRGRGLYSRSR